MYFPSVPLSYAVEITYDCNNHCSGCANTYTSERDDVLVEWKELFDRIAPPENRRQYAELIRISGGEPTLHPEFRRIIEYVDTFDIPHATFSNGRWEAPERIVETLSQCRNFVGILISLHGSTPQTHAAFTGSRNGAFEEACHSIRKATEAGLEVFTNTVLTKQSCEQVEEIIALSQELGAAYAVFNRYLGQAHPLEPDENQLRRTIQQIERLQQQGVSCHLGDCVPPCFVKNSSLGGNAGIELCAISPQGDVRPDNLTTYTFGNIFEHSIREIWQSEEARWYRGRLAERCLECVEFSRCRGGCRSLMIEYDLPGDPLMKDPIRNPDAETLELSPDWKPVPHFSVREESFGLLLCRYNWSVPVSFETKALIESFDGEHSLLQIQQQFGDEALDFVGHLYREGCVGFEV